MPEHLHLPLSDTASQKAARLAIGFAKEWGIKGDMLEERVAQLTPLAMRLETFLGKNNTLIINDTYNLDMDALKESLTYLCSFGKKRPLGIIVGLDEEALHLKADIEKRIDPFALDFRFVGSKEALPTTLPEDAVVLLKGTRKAKMERYAGSLRMQQHQTKLEINVSSLKHNVLEYKAKLSSETALLVMVKAQSYGSGLDQLFPFFDSLRKPWPFIVQPSTFFIFFETCDHVFMVMR